MDLREATYVGKACAYVTRTTGEVLVFDGPGHEELQIPKGTIETGERPREAVVREVREETGLGELAGVTPVATDVWTRRQDPPKRYVRHFFYVRVEEPRDAWRHIVRDGGDEHGATFELQWVDPSAIDTLALDLDAYLHALPTAKPANRTETAEQTSAASD